MGRTIHVDDLVIGGGASGVAFTEALIDHADVRVAIVERRHGLGVRSFVDEMVCDVEPICP